MRAVVLIGHGSLRPGAGAAMIRLAARVRATGVAPIVEAGFLNYSRPTFAQALARCVAHGATEVVIQPYFLIAGVFANDDLPRLAAAWEAAHPGIRLRLAAPLGDHPALAGLVLKRAAEAAAGGPAGARGLALMAHGSPDPAANGPVHSVARRVAASGQYQAVAVGFMELNEPCIPAAITALVGQGMRQVVAVPYFLQLGGHVAEDLPRIIGQAQQRYPEVPIVLAGHLGYDPLLAAVIADRATAASAG